MSRYLFKGKLLKLAKKNQKLPNGKIAKLEVIDHPGAALIVPFLDKNRLILIRQYRPVLRAYFWELPAGTLDPGEGPLSCARREITEEIGYAAKKFTKLGVIFPVPGYSTERIVLYKAEKLIKRKTNFDQDEVISSRILNRTQIQRLFRQGKIKDAKTICALAYCSIL